MTDDPRPAARPTFRPAEAALAVACGLVLVINIPVFASRLGSVLHTYPLYPTEGAEGPTIYPIWKLQGGHPLYEPTFKPPYAITWYNFLFYHVYSSILGLVGARGERMLLASRLITLAFGVLGAIGHRLLIRRVAGRGGRLFEAAATALVAVAWLGSNYMAWWVLSIRPDVGGAALVTWGLLAYLRAADRRSPAGMAVASILFLSGWAFKQSLVWVLFSVCLYTLVRLRDWRLLLPLALPCAAGMALTFAILGPAYRENTIAVQTTAGTSIRQAVAIFARISLQNGFFWLFPFVPLALRRAAPARGEEGAAAPARGAGALWLALAITFAYGFFALGHAGSNKNHVMEYYIVTTTLALAALRRVLALPAGRPRAVGLGVAVALLAPMALFPAAQLAAPRALGRIELADAAEYAARARLARDIDALDKPVLVFDDILAQPWHATGGRYPAFVPDLNWYWTAKAQGLFEGGGAEALIRRHEFRSLLLDDSMAGEMAAARASGYCEAPAQPEGIGAAGLKLLVPCEAAPR